MSVGTRNSGEGGRDMDTTEQTQDAGWRGMVAKASLALSIFTVFWFIAAALGTKLGLWGWQFGLGKMTIDWGLKLIFLASGVSVIALVLSLIMAPRKRAFILAFAALLIAGLSFGRIAAFWVEREAATSRKRLRDQFRPQFRRARPPAPHQIFGFLDFFLPPLRRSAQLQILSLLQEHRA